MKLSTSISVLSCIAALNAHAVINVNIQEVGADVVVAWSGSLTIQGLSDSTGTTGPAIVLDAASGTLHSNGDNYGYAVNSGTGFGTGGEIFFQPLGGGLPLPEYTFTGDYFGLDDVGGGEVLLPTGYTSGQAISGSLTYHDQSLSTLGISAGSYSWTEADTSDTIEMTVVPEVSTFMLYAASLAFVLGARRRRSIRTA
jgi:hypothetical protein